MEPILSDTDRAFAKDAALHSMPSTLASIQLRRRLQGWRGNMKKYYLVETLDIWNAFNSARWDCIMKASHHKWVTLGSLPGPLWWNLIYVGIVQEFFTRNKVICVRG